MQGIDRMAGREARSMWVVGGTTEALRGMRTLKGVSEGSADQWFARESRRLKPRLLKRSRPTPTDLGRSQPAYAGCAAVAATCSRQDR